MLYLIGLGLKVGDLSIHGKELIEKADEVYIEKYTSIPFLLNLNKEIKELSREQVESQFLIERAKNKNIALLVFGDPLFATTHISLIYDCKTNKIPYEVVHAPSIVNTLGEIGISVYNFGQIVSIPYPEENYKPTSFLEKINDNSKIGLHTLILPDPRWEYSSLIEFIKNKIDLDKLLVIKYREKLEIFWANKLRHIDPPFSLILLGKLNSIEKEFLNEFLNK